VDDLATAALVGVGAGALAYLLAGTGPKPHCVLEVRAAGGDGQAYMDPHWDRYLGPFSAVAIKIANGAVAWLSQPEPLVRRARDAGTRVWGWGYHYLSPWRYSGGSYFRKYASDAEAVDAEAVAAARAATHWQVDAYEANAECYLFGTGCGSGRPPTPKPASPAANAEQFAARFRALAPGIDLIWNGYQFTRYQRVAGGPTEQGFTAATFADYDAYSPMIYPSGPDARWRRDRTAAKWRKSASKADEYGYRSVWGPTTSTGRMSGAKATNWWLDNPATGPGVISLVAELQPLMVQIFYGAGSSPMLTAGNAANPALVRLVPMLQRAYRMGADFPGTVAMGWTAQPRQGVA